MVGFVHSPTVLSWQEYILIANWSQYSQKWAVLSNVLPLLCLGWTAILGLFAEAFVTQMRSYVPFGRREIEDNSHWAYRDIFVIFIIIYIRINSLFWLDHSNEVPTWVGLLPVPGCCLSRVAGWAGLQAGQGCRLGRVAAWARLA